MYTDPLFYRKKLGNMYKIMNFNQVGLINQFILYYLTDT